MSNFVTVYFSANQTIAGNWTTLLFDIVETDGTNIDMYNSTNGRFVSPETGYYDIRAQIRADSTLTGIRIVKNSNSNFPSIGFVPDSLNSNIFLRVFLGEGEFVTIDVDGNGDVLATSGLVPNTRATEASFTSVKLLKNQ